MANSVVFAASVQPQIGGSPTGTVTFLDGADPIGTGAVSAGAPTSLSVASLAVGAHNIAASYSGDSNFTASTSAAFTETVTAPTTSADFTFTVSGTATQTASAGQTVTFHLMPVPSPTTETFANPVTFSATGLPSGATATFSPATLPAGTAAPATPVTLTVQTVSAAPAIESRNAQFSANTTAHAGNHCLLVVGTRGAGQPHLTTHAASGSSAGQFNLCGRLLTAADPYAGAQVPRFLARPGAVERYRGLRSESWKWHIVFPYTSLNHLLDSSHRHPAAQYLMPSP